MEILDLGQRLADIYPEVENEVLTILRDDDKYSAMRHELSEIKRKHPHIAGVLGCDVKEPLEPDEYPLLVQALRLRYRLEDIEREMLYYRGHSDAISYLKKVGAL